MRLIATALSLAALCFPADAQDCRFFNVNDQSLSYRPTVGELTFHPVYDDAVECGFVREVRGNEWLLSCGDGAHSVIVGSSEPDKAFADILVFDGVFFWLECRKTT